MSYRTGLIALALLGLGLSSGCAENKMTRKNFDMIAEGSADRTEVEYTLGKGYKDRGNEWEYWDEEKNLTAHIYFDQDGKVTRKEWMDGNTGEWDGAAPG